MTTYDSANMREGIWKVYYGSPAGATTPDTMPLDSAVYGTPGGTWQAVGATQGGVTPDGLNPPETPVYVDHQRSAWARLSGQVETTFAFNLVETTPEKLYVVSSIGAQSSVAAGSSTKGSVSFKLTSPSKPDVAVLFEGIGGNGQPWRVFVPRARTMISSGGTIQSGSPQAVGVTVTAVPSTDSEAVEFRQVTPATGA